MCILLVTQTVACLVSAGELVWFLLCSSGDAVACLVSVGELAFLLLFTLLKTHALAIILQEVSWAGF